MFYWHKQAVPTGPGQGKAVYGGAAVYTKRHCFIDEAGAHPLVGPLPELL